MSQMTARPDPAPSRLKYRMERLMLTPLFRLLLRFGLPCLLTFGVASWWLSVRRQSDDDHGHLFRDARQGREAVRSSWSI